MPRKTLTFFFGRLNINTYVTDKKNLILDGVKTKNFFDQNEYRYGFFDISELSEINDEFVYGRLVKYKRILTSEVVDEKKHITTVGGLPYGLVGKSDFFLHFMSGILAYRPLISKISAKQFRHVFARLIEASHDNFFISAQVETINEDIRITEAIKSFDKISRIVFEIHPTNPSNRENYKILDEKLKNLNAMKLKQDIEAKEGGFNKEALLKDDSHYSLIMASDGYGNGSVHGIYQERTIVITTGDSPVRKEIAESDSPVEMLKNLMPAFKHIWERIKK